MFEELKPALQKHLESGKDWEKVETDIPGVFVVKIPGTKTRDPRLMVEVNPVDKTTGLPKKRKGLFVADFEMYLQFQEALMEEEVPQLIKVIDEINPEPASTKKAKKLKLKS
jgi:hypothetical protein